MICPKIVRSPVLPLTAITVLLAACSSIPDNAKPYSCTEFNRMQAKVNANPSEAFTQADTLRYNKINLVGFKAALPKHPSKEDTLRLIDDVADLQALQCRTAPDAVIHYTAQQVSPGSVRLGYIVEYPSGKPDAVKQAEGNLRTGKRIANESGTAKVKEFIQNCAAGAAPAHACKLGGL